MSTSVERQFTKSKTKMVEHEEVENNIFTIFQVFFFQIRVVSSSDHFLFITSYDFIPFLPNASYPLFFISVIM